MKKLISSSFIIFAVIKKFFWFILCKIRSYITQKMSREQERERERERERED